MKLLFTLFLMLILVPLQSFAAVDGYTTIRYRTQTIYISDSGVKEHKKEMEAWLEFLKKKIVMIQQLKLSKTIQKRLVKIPIFMEWNLWDAAAMYHPNKTWLVEHGYPPAKEKSVEVTNVTNFVDRTRLNQPYMLLHEFAHAYMDLYLTKKEKDNVWATYRRAVREWHYDSVEYTPGGDMVKVMKKAYALTNEQEYFAETTEAYLWINDFYPYNREDLKKHDPYGYKLMESIWK